MFWIKTCWIVLTHPKQTKPQAGENCRIVKMQNGTDLFMCDMIKPRFIPPADIQQLRDLMRHRMMFNSMVTGDKNYAFNCLIRILKCG